MQLVLTDRAQLSAQRPSASSPLTWHLADLSTKHALLFSGLGWGEMPLHKVDKDLAEGRLVELAVQGLPLDGAQLPMCAIYRSAAPPGPAGRWMIDRLKQCASTRRNNVLTA
ncbi:LysR substrate-binding domain-containing protein [Xanthomonas hortorum]|uniref:LysR substrate-binding domain-containing protein n=1 Tax=Xanthomonas hortorum pv. pelargonii TaxID=453602 RepID=A0A6V7BCR6_9XANT|nr:LysR substrate-binding domain-containing protein [Xanthomonas hortorum]MCE4355553.1 substrate-binding domain-containing protein [Xanthomonas hortorum pv. pelargonii]MCM5526374.1 substrate-binding domain-containing protein [Xanthomonas hortorum pv. pelargonii]MCM5538417.1 substrate-binding domain-containing protein [Xanthomonas hortorum pv. pelargonii]MCM5542644.1 substrate-binding domain-containing protein [Xanthomonas hortorum pv. pelargonii]MCM5546570.1 substrate-binding domain-containing